MKVKYVQHACICCNKPINVYGILYNVHCTVYTNLYVMLTVYKASCIFLHNRNTILVYTITYKNTVYRNNECIAYYTMYDVYFVHCTMFTLYIIHCIVYCTIRCRVHIIHLQLSHTTHLIQYTVFNL